MTCLPRSTGYWCSPLAAMCWRRKTASIPRSLTTADLPLDQALVRTKGHRQAISRCGGWSEIEGTGAWSDGPLAWLAFCTWREPQASCACGSKPGFPAQSGGKQHVTVAAGDRTLTRFDFEICQQTSSSWFRQT